MTCIVGLIDRSTNIVYIGGDSAGVGGLDIWMRADRKVWAKDGYAFGFTTSFRMGQLLRYGLTIPRRYPETDLMEFMVTSFTDAVRKCLKDGGFATAKDGAEIGGTFLVGHAGRLFRIDSDYQVGEMIIDYDACGCGEAYAKGALYNSGGQEPEARVLQALATAEAHSGGVRAPFHVVAV